MKAYMSTVCSPAAGAVITTYREHLAAKRPEAAEAEARAILAETERADGETIYTMGERYITDDAHHSRRCECWACTLSRLAESLAAILPELDRLEIESRRDAGGIYLGLL